MANSKDAKLETSNRRLDSWKDIAAYLGKDVTTAMRYARERALPVHRVPGNAKRQTVYAYSQEIDDWLLGRATRDLGLGTGEEQKAEGGRQKAEEGTRDRGLGAGEEQKAEGGTQKAEKGTRVSVLGVREQEEPTQTNRATAPITRQ